MYRAVKTVFLEINLKYKESVHSRITRASAYDWAVDIGNGCRNVPNSVAFIYSESWDQLKFHGRS
jgi:hypothetical protein